MSTKSEVLKPIGVTGLSIWHGKLSEEYLAQLKGAKACKIYQEMEDDAVIGTALDAVKRPLLAAEFSIVPASEEKADQAAADFIESCLYDMSKYSWRQHVLDLLDMLTFGWSASEIVLKKRQGMSGKPQSQFDDGKLGIDMLDPRGQETLDRWEFSEDGRTVEALIQRDPVSGKSYTLPMWKLVHAVYRSRKRNPEGRSPLRSLYRSWYLRKNLETIEAIGIERDLAGTPVIKLPYGASKSEADTAETIVRNLRNDEEAGVVLPPPATPDPQAQKWELTLLGTTGKAYDVRSTIRDYNKEILMRFFAQFLMLGMEKVGTQALVQGSQDFFSLALKSIQQELLEAWNQQLIPLLIDLNEFKGISGYPELDWADPGKADVQSLSSLVTSLTSANLLTADRELEEYLRNLAGLPDLAESTERAVPISIPEMPQAEQGVV